MSNPSKHSELFQNLHDFFQRIRPVQSLFDARLSFDQMRQHFDGDAE